MTLAQTSPYGQIVKISIQEGAQNAMGQNASNGSRSEVGAVVTGILIDWPGCR